MRKVALTTIDNDYSPFTTFVEWLLYDMEKGYNTCAKIGRLAPPDLDELTEQEQMNALEQVIDRIIELDPFNIYIKVIQED